jgi:hypothetical protein
MVENRRHRNAERTLLKNSAFAAPRTDKMMSTGKCSGLDAVSTGNHECYADAGRLQKLCVLTNPVTRIQRLRISYAL